MDNCCNVFFLLKVSAIKNSGITFLLENGVEGFALPQLTRGMFFLITFSKGFPRTIFVEYVASFHESRAVLLENTHSES
jgi:hypothetical protein